MTLPERYHLICGPFPLLEQHNLYWISLVNTSEVGKEMEAGICIYSDRDSARVFWYPEEARAALTILRNLEPDLVHLLEQQGMYTQEGRNEDNERLPH